MYQDFERWLNRILEQKLPQKAVAINFNIYEEEDFNWSIQMVACGSYTEGNDDWAADEVFSTEEDLYVWKQETDWEEICDVSEEMIGQYLLDGKYADKLKKFTAVGVGFVDGDLEIVYRKAH